MMRAEPPRTLLSVARRRNARAGVLVAALYPELVAPVLVAPLRYQVQIVIGGVEHIDAAGKAGVGGEYFLPLVPEKDTETFAIGGSSILHLAVARHPGTRQ